MNLIKMDTHDILVHSFDVYNDIHSLHVWHSHTNMFLNYKYFDIHNVYIMNFIFIMYIPDKYIFKL